MIFKLILNIDKSHGNRIPASYQYELSAAIYKILAANDKQYATWLHDNGFRMESSKSLKLFCFSNLAIPKFQIEGDRILILCEQVELYISFLPEISTMTFVQGSFVSQSFVVGDRTSTVRFNIQAIQLEPVIRTLASGNFDTLSPICISRQTEDRKIQYISPEDAEAGQRLFTNLTEKFRFFYNRPYDGDPSFTFKLLSTPKRKAISVKKDTPFESKVIGYHFRFFFSCDSQLMTIMQEAGAGEKGSMGFGFIKHKPGNGMQIG